LIYVIKKTSQLLDLYHFFYYFSGLFIKQNLMAKYKIFYIIFIFLFSLEMFADNGVVSYDTTSAIIRFTENKGQWENNVLFRANIDGGLLFAENKGITFLLKDNTTAQHGDEPITCKNPNCRHNLHKHDEDHVDTVNNSSLINKLHAYRMNFANINSNLKIKGLDAFSDYVNYYKGMDKTKWASNVKNYKSLLYENVYNDIDFHLYSFDKIVKYDFIVKPGANINDIQVEYEGVEDIFIKEGNLVVRTSVCDVTEFKPIAFEVDNGEKIAIECSFVLEGKTLKYKVKRHNRSNLLIIDPMLVASTFSGSLSDNFGFTATYDYKNNIYSAGIDFYTGYPVSMGAYQTLFKGGDCDIAIIKYDSVGSKRLYATYLGGNGVDVPHSLIVNSKNELIISGTTGSDNYPVSANAYDNTFNGGTPIIIDYVLDYNKGSDIVITKLNENGTSLLNSTYVGGTDNDGLNYDSVAFQDTTYYYVLTKDTFFYRQHFPSLFSEKGILRDNYADEIRGGLILDDNNNIFISTSTHSKDFPISKDAFQKTFGGGMQDACIFKLDNNLTTLVWSSYIGGSGNDGGYGITINSKNQPIVTGGTTSGNFPTNNKAINKNYQGGLSDGYVSVISDDGSELLASTYFGTYEQDQSFLVDVNREDDIYIFGQTRAKGSQLIKNALYNNPASGQFVSKISKSLDTLKWSTVFGSGSGVPDISPTAMLVDYCDMVYLVGWGGQVNYSMGGTGTKNLEVTPDAFQKTTDGSDFYLMVLKEDASKLNYATFFGGYGIGEHVDGGTSRFNKRGKVYQAVCGGCGGRSKDTSNVSKLNVMPTTESAWSRTNNSNNCNNAVFVFSFELPNCIADFELPPPGCAPYNAPFKNISFSASAAPVSYLWNFGDGTTSSLKDPTHMYNKAGTYSVKLIVTDNSSCNFQDSILKTFTILNDFTTSGEDTLENKYICNGDVVQIGLEPINHSGITYSWSPSSSLSDPTSSNPYAKPTQDITYSLIMSNGVCSTKYIQRVFVENISLNKILPESICKGSSVSILANSKGTATGFVWSNNINFSDTINTSSTDSVINVSPTENKSYYIKINGNVCKLVDSAIVNVFEIKVQTTDTAICDGNNIVIKANNLVSTDILKYKWTPTESIISGSTKYNPTVEPTETTTYYVEMTNQIGCTAIDSVILNVNKISLAKYVKEITCAGNCDGVIDITPSNGSLPYLYSWYNNPNTSNSISNLCIGTFIVKVTDNIGCFIIDTTILNKVDTFSIKITKTDNICYYDQKGTALVQVFGGETPYNFNWKNGKVDPYIDMLPAGVQEVTVRDKRGCQLIEKVEIKCLSNLALNTSKDDILCANSNMGKITANISGGKSPYTYNWSNGETTPTIENLDTGIYVVTVTDNETCYLTAQDTIKQPLVLDVSFAKKDITCFGYNNGIIKATVTGGIMPYKYTWSNGILQTDSLYNLSNGLYVLTVIDANNCQFVDSIEIIEPQQLSLKLLKQDVMCWGDSSGIINAIASGGTPYYQYTWNNIKLPKQSTVSNLKIGTYEVTVKDKNGCKINDKIEIIQNEPLDVTITSKDIECFGLYNGQLFVEAKGGSGPYIYSWENGYEKPIISNLTGGDYKLTVKDIYNCMWTGIGTIYSPDDISITSTIKQPRCFGDSNGSIDLSVKGGTQPYTFDWNNSLKDSIINNLSRGDYYVTVTDNKGCRKIENIKLSDAPILDANISIFNPNCYGENAGKAIATVTGGESPYKYTWNDLNNQTTDIATSLIASDYTLTVTDNRECEIIKTIKLTQPDSINVILKTISHNGCNGACVGSISLTAKGGISPYSYSWDNTAKDSVINSLCKGTHIVTVTDKNNCTNIKTYTIIDTTLFSVKETINNATCFGKCDAEININVTAYTHPLQIKWSNGLTGSNISYLCAGGYTLTVSDGAGCYEEKTINITQPPLLKVNIQKLTEISCFNYCNASALAVVSGGTPPFNYLWSNNTAKDTINSLCKGVYNITVDDINDCKAYNTVSFGDPIDLDVNIKITNTICKDFCSGRISVNAWGGVPPYKYLWNINGEIKEDSLLTDLCVGTYTVSVYDSRNCYTTKTVNIDIDYSKYSNVNITKSADSIFVGQSVTLTAENITNYKFDWVGENKMSLGNGVSITVFPIKQENYYLNAVDSFGCVFTDTATIYIREVLCEEPYIYIPNAFTPNNDQQNDMVFVRSAVIKKIYFAIFDRWGEKVFETYDMNRGWDGKYKGNALDPAVYDYYLEVSCWGDEKFFKKGNITLIR